jgi:hypothetical protein
MEGQSRNGAYFGNYGIFREMGFHKITCQSKNDAYLDIEVFFENWVPSCRKK